MDYFQACRFYAKIVQLLHLIRFVFIFTIHFRLSHAHMHGCELVKGIMYIQMDMEKPGFGFIIEFNS